ncbi:MAG: histidine kinase, partial [Pseudomonadota bacterium]
CVGLTQAMRAKAAQAANHALEKQRAQAALDLAQGRMRLLQSQLSPHFLFNSLGSISYLARSSERDTLVDAVAALGNLLRFTIENASRSSIAVAEELRFARDYVGLQRLRFGERFDCHFDVDDAHSGLVSAVCLPFTLQPLLENAFRHEVEKHASSDSVRGREGVLIRVNVAVRDDRVHMLVENSRPVGAREEGEPNGHGTGLSNLERRLTHTYRQAGALTREVTESTYRVEVSFPVRIEGRDA